MHPTSRHWSKAYLLFRTCLFLYFAFELFQIIICSKRGGQMETPGQTCIQPRFSIRTHANQLPHHPTYTPLASQPLLHQYTSHELFTNQYSLPSNVDFPGCILTLPTRFGLCPFEPSLPSCAISAHDPRAPLGLWAH